MRFLGPLLSVATKEGCLEEKERKATQIFLPNTSIRSFLTRVWAKVGSHRPADTAGRCAPGAPGGDTGSGCPSEHAAQQDRQSHHPVAPHLVEPSYSTTNGHSDLGDLPSSWLVLLPHSDSHTPLASAYPSLPAWGVLASPPALPFGSQVIAAAVLLVLTKPPLLCVPW